MDCNVDNVYYIKEQFLLNRLARFLTIFWFYYFSVLC